MSIEELFEEAARIGWATGVLPEARSVERTLRNAAKDRRLTLIPSRSGESDLSDLRPTARDKANPASLSAQVGLGEQPLHTDGAHLARVPDVVVLWCDTPSLTETRIWPGALEAARRHDTSGIFMVAPGGERWLTPAVDEGGLRFDPGCMTPCDAMARDLYRTLCEPPADAVKHVDWATPGTVLVLRNRVVLHGRAAMAQGDEARVLHRFAFREES